MAAIELRFLGDLAVLRDGERLPLPPSKKTRALLAWLALNAGPVRRERLCELFWDVPDDPRGSLRWSLSKLRRLVDDERERIIADRTHVRFDASDVAIDVTALHDLVERNLEAATIEALEDAASRFQGNLLEGLELSSLHEFHGWCVTERERTARAQITLLRTLIERLGDAAERVLPHARRLVALDPYDAEARAALIRRLVSLGRAEEAEQQYRLGTRLLKEVGAQPTGLLYAAWRGGPGREQSAHSAGASARSGTARVQAGLYGREAELALLAEAFARVAAERRPGVWLLCGEPGIGKTRLLDAVAALARESGACTLRANAYEPEAFRPFAIWIDALRTLDADAAAAVFTEGSHNDRERLFEAVNAAVTREATQRPVVALFDDLQWCDESSAAALHYVVRSNAECPLFAVLAGRNEELRDNGAVQRALRALRRDGLLRELRLGPLPADALAELIAARAPCADRARLARECGGNPLLAIELAHAEAAGENASSLDGLIAERLARLDADTGELVRWAAVLAPRTDAAFLARVSSMDANRIGAALENAERGGLLVAHENGFGFHHDLVARSVYKEISQARRGIMHRRVAELLEQDTALDLGRAADLAHHAAQSGDPALAARAMHSAGRLCLRFFANDDALALARNGLQWTEQLTGAERVRITLELRDIMLAAAPLEDWQAAAEEFAALAEQALDHGELAHARLGYQMASYVRWAHGQWAGARAEALQAERVTRGASDDAHIVGLAETAKCLAMLERDLAQADALLMEAQALATRARMRHYALPAALGMLRFHENRFDEAEELFEEARALCKLAGDRVNEFQANEYLVMIDVERGRIDSARKRCATLIEIGEKLREGSEAPFAHALEGLCRYALEDDDTQLAAASEALRHADAKHRLAYTLTRAALLDLARGRLGAAFARAGEALAHAEALERSTEMLLAHAVLAEASRAGGDQAAWARHRAALEALADAPVATWARERAGTLADAAA
jgi:DNA-binding SARP family transcriptional activator